MVANANVILKPRTAPPGVVGAKAGAIAPPTPLQGLPNPVGNNAVSSHAILCFKFVPYLIRLGNFRNEADFFAAFFEYFSRDFGVRISIICLLCSYFFV